MADQVEELDKLIFGAGTPQPGVTPDPQVQQLDQAIFGAPPSPYEPPPGPPPGLGYDPSGAPEPGILGTVAALPGAVAETVGGIVSQPMDMLRYLGGVVDLPTVVYRPFAEQLAAGLGLRPGGAGEFKNDFYRAFSQAPEQIQGPGTLLYGQTIIDVLGLSEKGYAPDEETVGTVLAQSIPGMGALPKTVRESLVRGAAHLVGGILEDPTAVAGLASGIARGVTKAGVKGVPEGVGRLADLVDTGIAVAALPGITGQAAVAFTGAGKALKAGEYDKALEGVMEGMGALGLGVLIGLGLRRRPEAPGAEAPPPRPSEPPAARPEPPLAPEPPVPEPAPAREAPAATSSGAPPARRYDPDEVIEIADAGRLEELGAVGVVDLARATNLLARDMGAAQQIGTTPGRAYLDVSVAFRDAYDNLPSDSPLRSNSIVETAYSFTEGMVGIGADFASMTVRSATLAREAAERQGVEITETPYGAQVFQVRGEGLEGMSRGIWVVVPGRETGEAVAAVHMSEDGHITSLGNTEQGTLGGGMAAVRVLLGIYDHTPGWIPDLAEQSGFTRRNVRDFASLLRIEPDRLSNQTVRSVIDADPRAKARVEAFRRRLTREHQRTTEALRGEAEAAGVTLPEPARAAAGTRGPPGAPAPTAGRVGEGVVGEGGAPLGGEAGAGGLVPGAGGEGAPRLAQVTAQSGILQLAFHRGAPGREAISEGNLEAMLKGMFPDHTPEAAPIRAGLGRSRDLQLYRVTLWDQQGRIDYAAADRAVDMLGGRLLREPPGGRTEAPPVRAAAPAARAALPPGPPAPQPLGAAAAEPSGPSPPTAGNLALEPDAGPGGPRGPGEPPGEPSPLDPVELTEPILRNPISREVVRIAGEVMEETGIPRDARRFPLISDQLVFLMNDGQIDLGRFVDTLERNNLTVREFTTELWRPAVSDAGRRLQPLSVLARRFNRLARTEGQAGRAALEAIRGMGSQVDEHAASMGWFRRLENVRRGLLVSQLSTTVRNAVTQYARVGVGVLADSMDYALQKTLKAAGMNIQPSVHPLDGFLIAGRAAWSMGGRIATLGQGGKYAQRLKDLTDTVLEAFHPRYRNRLFMHYASDVSTGVRDQNVVMKGGDKVFNGLESVVDFVNTLNRGQEYIFRRAVLVTKLDSMLTGRGDSPLHVVLADHNQLTQELRRDFGENWRRNEQAATVYAQDPRNIGGRIDEDMMNGAINQALEMTFAEQPKYDSVGYHFVKLINKSGLTLVQPFPRFLTNAMRFLYQWSPTGFLRILSKEERAKMGRGDMQAMSRASVGTAMFLAAYQVRTSDDAGERWYEVNVRLPWEQKKGKAPVTRTVDIRPFNPFAAHFFVADVLARAKGDRTWDEFAKGENQAASRLYQMGARDWVEGILSTQLRAGTGLALVDGLFKQATTFGSPEEWMKHVGRVAGEYVAGYLTPIQQITDVLAEFDEDARVVRDRRQEPFQGPIMSRIPGQGQQLPELELPTRAGPVHRDYPLLKQLTGLLINDPRNPLELELARLQFTPREIFQGTRSAEADALVKHHMGQLSEDYLIPVVQSPEYQGMADGEKGYYLKEILSTVRQTARGMALVERPELFVDLRKKSLRQRLFEQELEEESEAQLGGGLGPPPGPPGGP
jgi:hypothetical protein